jgi:hypothetical protein
MSDKDTLTPEAIEELRLTGDIKEGAWTGSMGGNDPDFLKLGGGLKKWATEMVAKSPHPFTEMVRHLRGKVANPERLVAWLIDQVKGTTSWRKGNKGIKEAAFDNYAPTLGELRRAFDIVKDLNETTAVQEAEGNQDDDVVEIAFGPEGRIAKYSDGRTEEV